MPDQEASPRGISDQSADWSINPRRKRSSSVSNSQRGDARTQSWCGEALGRVGEGGSPLASRDGSRVRVLHVLEAIFGGTALHLADIVQVVRDVDHIVVVPSQRHGGRTDQEAIESLRRSGADVHIIEMRRTPTHPDNLFAYFRLRKLMRKTRPDVVHGHSSIGGALARAAASAVPKTPTVWTPNGVLISRPVLAVERRLARRTTATVAVSPSEKSLIQQTGLDKSAEVVVIPNGINIDPVGEPLDVRALLDIPAGAPVIGTISRLVPQKSPLDFIACCQAIHEIRPDAHFVLIGDGPLQDEVDARLRTWDHRGHFHQIAGLSDAARALSSFDVFVLLSSYEGAPYAPLEAMRAGVPVVLTDVVGSRDVVEDGVSGYLVPIGDATAAAKAVLGLIDSPQHRSAMSRESYLRLYRLFDREQMGTSLSELYHRLAGVARTAEVPEVVWPAAAVGEDRIVPVIEDRKAATDSPVRSAV